MIRGACLVGILLALAGCTPREEKPEPESPNPTIQSQMQQIERTSMTLSRSIDAADISSLDSTLSLLGNQFLQTRALPVKRLDGSPVNMTSYTRDLDNSIRLVQDMQEALASNSWDILSRRYNALRTACVRCHNSYVDREIPMRLATPRNF